MKGYNKVSNIETLLSIILIAMIAFRQIETPLFSFVVGLNAFIIILRILYFLYLKVKNEPIIRDKNEE